MPFPGMIWYPHNFHFTKGHFKHPEVKDCLWYFLSVGHLEVKCCWRLALTVVLVSLWESSPFAKCWVYPITPSRCQLCSFLHYQTKERGLVRIVVWLIYFLPVQCSFYNRTKMGRRASSLHMMSLLYIPSGFLIDLCPLVFPIWWKTSLKICPYDSPDLLSVCYVLLFISSFVNSNSLYPPFSEYG